MSENIENIDLNVDTAVADLSDPLLAPGKYRFLVTKPEVVPCANNGRQIRVTLQTLDPSKTEDGNQKPAGSMFVRHQILANPSGGWTIQSCIKAVGSLAQACGLKSAPLNNLDWVPSLENREVTAWVKVEEESKSKYGTKTYPRKNSVSYFVIDKK